MTHPLATALAWIGSVYVTMVIAITVLFVGSEIAARVKRWRSSATPTTTEPDPIESYPFGALPPITSRVVVWVQHPGALPIPLNPIGPSEADMRVRS